MAFSNTQWVQIGFALTSACKLGAASLEDTVYYQTKEHRGALDMSLVLQRLIRRIQALITPHMDVQEDRDVFYHYEKATETSPVVI